MSSLAEYRDPFSELRMILSGEDELVLVVEGPGDKRFWSEVSSASRPGIRIYSICGKGSLRNAVGAFEHSHLRFVYDRDFDPIISDPRAIAYPGRDFEAFLLGSVQDFQRDASILELFLKEVRLTLDVEGSSNPIRRQIASSYLSAWELASLLAFFKELNQERNLSISFNGNELLFSVLKRFKRDLKKGKGSRENFVEKLINSVRKYFQAAGEMEPSPQEVSGVDPSGKDVLWIFSYFEHAKFLSPTGNDQDLSAAHCSEVLGRRLFYHRVDSDDSRFEFICEVLGIDNTVGMLGGG